MNKQTGEGEIVILLIIAVLVYLIWIAISFAWHFVSTVPSTEKISAQQSIAKSIGVSFDQYIANACELEKVCQRYNNVRKECATAGSIKECIKIKMGNTDYSSCEGGNFFGYAPGTVDVSPTYNQCIFNKISGLFWMIGTASTHSPTQASDPLTKYAPPAASSGVQPNASFDPSAARLLQSASGTAKSRRPSPSGTNSLWEPPVSDASETPPPPHPALALDKYTRALALYSGLRNDAENGNAGAFGALSHFANDGDSTAQLELGRLYDNRKNMLLANYWYRKSANQGDPHAQIALGFNYLLGHGVSVDPVESYKWFYLAARNVYSSTDELTLARTQLKVIELTRALTPAQIVLAESKAMQWLKAHHTR